MSASNLVADTIWKEIESTSSVTDDQLSILHFLFGKNFERATRIVDQRGVKRISGRPSGRFVFQPAETDRLFHEALVHSAGDCPRSHEHATSLHPKSNPCSLQCPPPEPIALTHEVVGESRRKEEYLCFSEHFCGCHSFFYDVVNRGEQLCCKHQLAARLAASLGVCVEVKVSDEELALLLSKL